VFHGKDALKHTLVVWGNFWHNLFGWSLNEQKCWFFSPSHLRSSWNRYDHNLYFFFSAEFEVQQQQERPEVDLVSASANIENGKAKEEANLQPIKPGKFILKVSGIRGKLAYSL
jgi:hypothetical protein